MRHNVWVSFDSFAHHINVVFIWYCVVESALHQDGGYAFFCCSAYLIHDLLYGVCVCGWVIRVGAVKGAERTVCIAYVGVVEVGVDDVSYAFWRVVLCADMLSERCQVE